MAYAGINRQRFSYLLSWGTDAFELKKFFTQCRAQLIQRGAKVQNLPHGVSAQIRALAFQLPGTTDDIVRAWFADNITMLDPEDPTVVVATFKEYEEFQETLPEQLARRLSRSCLVALFDPTPPDALLAFLRTAIGQPADTPIDEPDVAPQAPSSGASSSSYVDLLPVLVDLVDGKNADENLSGLPPDLSTFISGLQYVVHGNFGDARSTIESLPLNSPARTLLEQFATQRENRHPGTHLDQRGVRIEELALFDSTFDFDKDEVLAYCVKADSPTAVFLKPAAVISNGTVRLLTPENRRLVFPETGDIIAFEGRAYPRQPRRGEVGIWHVQTHATDKPTRCHLASEKRAIYQVHSVPFASTDHDSVREYLKQHAGRLTSDSTEPLLFQLKDGPLVGSHKDYLAWARDETYEDGLPFWTTLSGFRLDGRLLIPGPLPKEHWLYECGDLASTVRKLFRPLVGPGRANGGLTKALLRELAQHLGRGEAGLDDNRTTRIRTELARLEDHPSAIEALVDVALAHPVIKARVDESVQREAAKQLAAKKDLGIQISRLESERDAWVDRIKQQKEEHKRLRDSTAKVVRSAFEKARNDGLSTLAEMAVFQSLESLSAGRTPPKSPVTPSTVLEPPAVRALEARENDLVEALRALGVFGQRAAAVAAVATLARSTGLLLCIQGVAARLAVQIVAETMGRSIVLLDATIGMTDVATVTQLFELDPPNDTIAILDANLSALDIYGRPLIDRVLGRLSSVNDRSSAYVILGLSDSIGSLPVPRTINSISLLVDLDRDYTFSGFEDVDDLMTMVASPDDGTIYRRLWRPAADRVRNELQKFDVETRSLALAILAAH